jgi:hypothetical protein
VLLPPARDFSGATIASDTDTSTRL